MTPTDYTNAFLSALNQFYSHYLVSTSNGTFQVFESLTYGDMVISLLLLCILFVLIFKWFWEVLR